MSSLTDSPFRFGAPSPPVTSSPASPSLFGPCDSSPLSSPAPQQLSLSPPASPGLAHPFAASTKAVHPPRLYEKRVSRGDFDREVSFGSDAIHLDDSPSRLRHATSTSVPHDPLAGDANAAWTPPEWEKKPSKSDGRTLSSASASSSDSSSVPPATLLTSQVRIPPFAYDPETISLSDDESEVQPVYKSRKQLEKEVWEKAIEKAVNEANGVINLDNSGLIGTPLTRIPPSVADLASLVVLQLRNTAPTAEYVPRNRPFTRSVTMPSDPFRPPPFLGTERPPRLVKSPSMAHMRQERNEPPESRVNMISLYLAQNQINKLPLELFWLQGLVVLNLRGNAIKYMPPQIAHLKNLQMLTISQNKLTYLPAEMLNMRLTTLVLKGNPWLRQPPAKIEGPSEREFVSATISHFTVPALEELCLRRLLSEHEPEDVWPDFKPGQTNLEAHHSLPLPDDYPAWMLKDLRACCPRSVAKPDLETQTSPTKRMRRSSSSMSDGFAPPLQTEDEEDKETHSGLGVCLSPVHAGKRAVFVRHAEERFEWEHVVAGQDVGVEGGVPVLWRGCSSGCLNFLDEA